MKRLRFRLGILILTTFLLVPEMMGQYFGRNKPRYERFDFKLYETPHFDIYHYLKDQEMVVRLADQSELWYKYLGNLTDNTLDARNPIIFYNDHADFQQTNTISGHIGVTTGGVTEALKNRVTMPLTISNQKTFQILGHELVHAFQYDLILNGDSTSIRNLANLPLFMVEGMAEYLTRGQVDPHTSMWMRDIVINDKIPTVKELANPKYFPYRYGQTFWSVLTGIYGDRIIAPYFRETAKQGMTGATTSVLGMSMEKLNETWQNSLKNHYYNILGSDAKEHFFGKELFNDENAGRLNISPSLSPNGRYIIFLSEKGLFTTDLYLADVRSGKIIRKVASTLRDSDIDNLDVFESSGTWSPDSKQYAFVTFNKGRNEIVIKKVKNGRDVAEFNLENQGISAINSPRWSPNGRYIAFTGLIEGRSDLFLLDVRSGRVRRITVDGASDIQPGWSPDGQKIVFATDRRSFAKRQKGGKWTYDIAVYDMETEDIEVLDLFYGANNLNPSYNENGEIWFLSDRDGYRNIYSYTPGIDSLYQRTNVLTGISGITTYAPALSIAEDRDLYAFTHYFDGKYTIRAARESAFIKEPVNRHDVNLEAARLPIPDNDKIDIVDRALDDLEGGEVPGVSAYQYKPYEPKFKLDYVGGGGGVGVGTGAIGGGVGMAGGVDMLFSDILGDNQLYAGLALNGQVFDFGGALTYINRKGRIQWGASFSHIPRRTGTFSAFLTQDDEFGEILVERTDLIRIYEDQLGIFARLPITTNIRAEINASTTYSYFRWDQYDDIYRVIGGNQLAFLTSTREKIPIEGDEIVINGLLFKKDFLHSVGGAFVGDNSFFGLTSPMAGHRYRVGVNKYFGSFDFYTITADFRKYFFLNPISIAVRGMHYARLGQDANVFYPLYVGDMGLVRGYEFVGSTRDLFERYNLTVDQLTGSKLLMGSIEFRLPFTGPERLALIKSGILFSDIAFFIDGGVAFNDYRDITFGEPNILERESAFVMSAGMSLRVNLFGAMIVEPYYAFPLRQNSKGVFGINFIPGW